jgi:hypothetical protein
MTGEVPTCLKAFIAAIRTAFTALLDREVFSEPPSDGEFAIHHRKRATQKKQRPDLRSLDIGSQGRRRLRENHAKFA